MGINTGDLDSHICSKVISTLVSDFFTEFPQITPLCIMCVWSMGKVKEKYFKYESYGYQYVGHFASSKDKNIFLHAHHIPLIFLILKLYRQIMLRGGLKSLKINNLWLGKIRRQLVRVLHRTSVLCHRVVLLSERDQTIFDLIIDVLSNRYCNHTV